ncbi:hypothetical protein GTW15_19415 [Vibrio cholerae]|nr:hypothetical protein [Vibrio cholerae]
MFQLYREKQNQFIRNTVKYSHYRANKRLKRDCQRAAFRVPLSRGGYGCCV